jgi:heterodisulfide reductase subunit A
VSEHPRIGIFLCECGGEISNRIDLTGLAARAREFPGVIHISIHPFTCSPDGLKDLKRKIADERIDRVLIAGCSPRTHGTLLQSLAEESGLNWNFIRMVNLREHCARVHAGDIGAATEKAARLLRMGAAAALHAEAVEWREVDVAPEAAVIGAGISGMTAALSLARRGVSVTLVEQEDELGGTLRDLAGLYPKHESAAEFLRPRIEAVERHEHIRVLHGARMTGLTGHAGNFEIGVDRNGSNESLRAGVVIFATGAREWIPPVSASSKNVTSLTGLHGLLKSGDLAADRIVFVLSSDGPISRIPASIALFAHSVLEAAAEIRKTREGASVSILFQDLPESAEETARELFRSGVRFVRYGSDNPPRISATGMEVRECESGNRMKIDSDLTVLATGLCPSEGTLRAGELSVLWHDGNGFLIEPYLRLRPGEVFDRGVYVAGTAHGPAGVAASMAQAFGAASRALGFLRKGKIGKRALVAVVDEEVCRGCGQCEEVCAFGAARLVDREGTFRKSEIDDVLCVGCGFCVSECISGAIRLPCLTGRQVRAMVAGAGQR